MTPKDQFKLERLRAMLAQSQSSEAAADAARDAEAAPWRAAMQGDRWPDDALHAQPLASSPEVR